MKKYPTLVLVVSCLIVALARPADTSMSQQSASAFPYCPHWANIYSSDVGYFGGPYNGHLAARVRETADGGFAIALTRWRDSASNGFEDMGAIMLDPSGQPKWGTSPLSCGDDGECSVTGMAVLSDGRIAVIARYYENYESTDCYIALMMLGADGSYQWIKTFLGSFLVNEFDDLQATADGGLLLAGQSAQGHWVARLNSAGKIVWQARLDAAVQSLQQTPDGGFIAVGLGGGDAWIAKFDASENITWQRSLGDPAAADGFHRVLITDDGYIAVGETEGLGASLKDIWVVKFDFQGHIGWQRAFSRRGTGFSNGVEAIVRLHEGGYLLCGNSGYGFALRLDPSGNLLWGRKYSARLADAIQTKQGDFVLIGEESKPSNCYLARDYMRNILFAARVNALGMIGKSCCAIGAADFVGRETAAVPYDTHFAAYHSPASVGSLPATDPGLVPVTFFSVCLAGLR